MNLDLQNIYERAVQEHRGPYPYRVGFAAVARAVCEELAWRCYKNDQDKARDICHALANELEASAKEGK